MAFTLNGKLYDFSYMSDAEVDAAYAAYFDAKDLNSAAIYGAEIVDRLATVSAFLGGLFGNTKFPLYEARGGFVQTSAQTSVAKSAGNLATSAGNAAATVFGMAEKTFWIIVGGLFLLGALYIFVRYKK